ncbi:Single-stranded DNA-binding protein [Labilithrix luteola]|uniref:Single-stranded DNA-binding protein n=1 Tax=Labilithrix luteola TaxID=1391654 RepID=A0A0K1QED6_9BACT|nr:single-stranded DNA-binding protein [Labilithrix luteola]AKV04032.1 Single-stranded DNA-binding protein [Labilithrix luteola]
MAEGLNKVMLLGNLGSDPELRTTANGQQFLKLSLATSFSFIDKNNQKQERTEWHSVKVWGKRAEPLSRMLAKGARILVEGRIESYSYEKDGSKRYGTDIIAEDVHFAGSPRSSGTSTSTVHASRYVNGSAAVLGGPGQAANVDNIPF